MSTHLAKARDILEGAQREAEGAKLGRRDHSVASGYSSGNLEDSEVNDKTSKRYKESLSQYTTTPVLDSSVTHSTTLLKALRKQRMLHEKMKQYNSRTPFQPDTDKMLLSRDIPNFKDEVQVSRNSAYSAMNPFNIVVKNGRRV